MFDRLQGRKFFTVHQSESVANILGAASASDPMDIIFRVLRHIVVDDVAHAGDVEPTRRDIRRDHHFVLAALESFERFDSLPLSAVGMQACDGMPGIPTALSGSESKRS